MTNTKTVKVSDIPVDRKRDFETALENLKKIQKDLSPYIQKKTALYIRPDQEQWEATTTNSKI